MPKYLLFVLGYTLFINTTLLANEKLDSIRTLYKTAGDVEESNEKLLAITQTQETPTIIGYYACATALNAQYVFSPFNKLEYFQKGTHKLDSTIQQNQNNVELRFIRFCIQSQAPFFLGYNTKLEEDKAIILTKLTTIDCNFIDLVVNYLLRNKNCTEEEKKRIRELAKKHQWNT